MNKKNMEIGYVGFGKMGRGMTERLMKNGWRVTIYHRNPESVKKQVSSKIKLVDTLSDLVASQQKPRLLWLMVPHTAVDEVLDELVPQLNPGDTVIDGGNSFFEKSMERFEKLKKRKINFLDAGVSGGPGGAKGGACVMVGGEKKVFTDFEKLFQDISIKNGYAYVGKAGAGHFVKMVHNGIEYGMMQALAEGFTVMKESPFKLNLKDIAELYNHGSVIESRLVGWLSSGFEQYGPSLRNVSGSVDHTGEGKWTVLTAKKLKIETPIIKGSYLFRVASEKKPSYTGKILSLLRNQFGGHDIKRKS